tara:strand:- start:799 stop:1656 length:858 start_codon:yes stop_codon:yes gene_type:complete
MNILFISDFGLHHTPGGAQRSNAIVIEEGRKRGHTIVEMFYDSNPLLIHYGYDVVISSNLETFSQAYSNIIDFLNSCDNHARLEHDANRYLSQESRKKLWENCRISFFLTEFHRDMFFENYGEDYFQNIEIVPDPLDPEVFYDMGKEREDKTLYVGFMHPLKGTDNFIGQARANPSKEFVVAGWSQDGTYEAQIKQLDNVEFLGRVDHSKMTDLYNSYKNLYYMPEYYEPFCRSVGEALMCGMSIESNDIVGSLHFHEKAGKEEFVSQCGRAPEIFWEKIENEFV